MPARRTDILSVVECLAVRIYLSCVPQYPSIKGKGKVHLRTGYEGPCVPHRNPDPVTIPFLKIRFNITVPSVSRSPTHFSYSLPATVPDYNFVIISQLSGAC